MSEPPMNLAPAEDGAPSALRRNPLVKICGLTREQDVQAAVQAGADFIGFVCFPPSPRHVGAARAVELARDLPPSVTPVLLFVNEDPATVQAAAAALPGCVLQFHGDETPAQCLHAAAGHPFWRVARMRAGFDLVNFAASSEQAQAVLLDAHVESYGGAGKSFDWSLVPAGVPARLVLSGGLNPANVTDGIERLRPWAVDVSSGVEVSKGIKDAGLMKAFCEAVHSAARHAPPC